MAQATSPIDAQRVSTSRSFAAEPMVRRAAILVLALIAVLNAGEFSRRVSFWATGSVNVQGAKLFLNPSDECLTYFVLEDGVWEPEETRQVLQRLRPGDTFIDVGANIGWYTVLASRAVGETGRVIAFEPDPANFAILQRNVAANGCENVLLVQKALSNEPGSITLFQHDRNKGMHSLLKSDETKQAVEVEAVLLDDFLVALDRPVNSVALTKIDVEGAEGFVLDGMRRTLRDNPQMQLLLEFAPDRLLATGYDPASLIGGLEAEGFQIHELGTPGSDPRPVKVAQLLEHLARENREYTNLLLSGQSPRGP